MQHSENLGSFFMESKPLLKEYLEAKLEIFRLQSVKIISQSAGWLVWLLISLFLLFSIILFAGIVLGCWLSELVHSYILGFGLTTLVLVLIFAFLIAFRKGLFISPIMNTIIRSAVDDMDEQG
ncbi:MAG: hypothetical protein ACHQET_03070 [Chitinophagales bacterium]